MWRSSDLVTESLSYFQRFALACGYRSTCSRGTSNCSNCLILVVAGTAIIVVAVFSLFLFCPHRI